MKHAALPGEFDHLVERDPVGVADVADEVQPTLEGQDGLFGSGACLGDAVEFHDNIPKALWVGSVRASCQVESTFITIEVGCGGVTGNLFEINGKALFSTGLDHCI